MIYNKGFGNVPGILNGPSDPITGPSITSHSSSGAWVDVPPSAMEPTNTPGVDLPSWFNIGELNKDLLIAGLFGAFVVWLYLERRKL